MFTDCYCTQFRRASNALTSIYDRELAPAGMKITQFSLLRALERLGSATYSDLAKEAALDKTTISRSIRLLIDAGWVNVSSDDDARIKIAQLSKTGIKALRRAETYWKRAQAKVAEEVRRFMRGPAETGLLDALEAVQRAGHRAARASASP